VLDLSRILAGPTLAQTLGDLGAEVIKVEEPRGGDPTRTWGPPFVGRAGGQVGDRSLRGADRSVSAYFVSANRGKRSIAIDLKDPAGRSTFLQLVERADVLVENFLPARWGAFRLTDRTLARVNPRLIRVSVTGYGRHGERAGDPAFDLILQGETGLMSLTGFAAAEPVRVGVAVVDLMTALQGVVGTLAALYERQRSGRGRRVEVSMADAGTSFLSYAAQSWLADGHQPAALGSKHPNLSPYQAFATRDGWLLVAVGSDDMFLRLCEAVGRTDLRDDPRLRHNAGRLRHRVELERELGATFARRTRAAWSRRLKAARVPNGPVQSVGEAVGDARRRGQVERLPRGVFGALETIAAPWIFAALGASPAAGRRPQARRSAPALGEHTDEILRELGVPAVARRRYLASLSLPASPPEAGSPVG
jgi:crotonobetainyl-CoA:carnitine CoA-transferase CaiB-like acyl-CoA transferase